eukprot:7381020-Prymnesium_polylepis.1
MSSQSTLLFGAARVPAPAAASTAAQPPVPEAEPAKGLSDKELKALKAARGELSHGRQSEIERTEGALMNYAHNWEQRHIVSSSAIAKMKYSQ